LENVLRLHGAGQAVVGGLLGIEGLHALDNDVAFVERFYAAGVRMAAVRNSSVSANHLLLLLTLKHRCR
jgi:hypothetical protein